MMAEEYESAEEKLNSMMDGTYDFSGGEDAAEEEVTEDVVEEVEADETANDEDTDQVEDTESDEVEDGDTEEDTLEDTEDDESDEESDTEENALVDDDKGNTASDEVDGDGEVSEGDGQAEGEAEVNYQTMYEGMQKTAEEDKAKYAELQRFHDIVTGEFKANGKMVKGFTDPEKQVQAQQAYYGLESKMKTVKPLKPFLKPLYDGGYIDDPARFNLLMDIDKGDKEALKKFMVEKGIDPFELDMDNVSHEQKSHVSTPLEMAFDDVMENAGRSGVQEQMSKIVTSDWDNDSVIRLLDRPQDSAVLIEQMGNGIYDAVQERIAENVRTDVNGAYGGRSNYDQYMIANQQLETEYQQYVQGEQARQQQAAPVQQQRQAPVQQAAPVAGGEDVAAKQYRDKVKASEAKAAEARAKATSMSKPKGRAKKKATVNPVTLSGDDFQSYFDDLLKF